MKFVTALNYIARFTKPPVQSRAEAGAVPEPLSLAAEGMAVPASCRGRQASSSPAIKPLAQVQSAHSGSGVTDSCQQIHITEFREQQPHETWCEFFALRKRKS